LQHKNIFPPNVRRFGKNILCTPKNPCSSTPVFTLIVLLLYCSVGLLLLKRDLSPNLTKTDSNLVQGQSLTVGLEFKSEFGTGKSVPEQ